MSIFDLNDETIPVTLPYLVINGWFPEDSTLYDGSRNPYLISPANFICKKHFHGGAIKCTLINTINENDENVYKLEIYYRRGGNKTYVKDDIKNRDILELILHKYELI